ncbi:MAG: sigma-70 family RNA polymerase sigma factor [Planctomycetes bacterium]|nr:sigma-70 family RNA polymerase sigma factor [Planctomycetota bacterium]
MEPASPPSSVPGTDQTAHLLHRIQAGDPSAENRLFARYTGRVLQLVRRKLGQPLRSRIESMDVVQEALAEAYTRLSAFDPRRDGAFLGWLGRIVSHKVLEAYRYSFRARRRADREVPLEEEPAAPADDGDRALEAILVGEAADHLVLLLGTLKDSHRKALTLRYFEGLDIPEVAARLGRSPDACRVLIARALHALQHRVRRAGLADRARD